MHELRLGLKAYLSKQSLIYMGIHASQKTVSSSSQVNAFDFKKDGLIKNTRNHPSDFFGENDALFS